MEVLNAVHLFDTFSWGNTERLRNHASECTKLQELNILGDSPAGKRQKIQKVLTFGATRIKVFIISQFRHLILTIFRSMSLRSK